MFHCSGSAWRCGEEYSGTGERSDRVTFEYAGEVVEACIAGFQSLNLTFETERKAVDQAVKLGPMLSEEYKRTRRIFLQDLAAR